jgi:transposase
VPDWLVRKHQQKEPSAMQVGMIGLDRAKNIVQVHGVDACGGVVLRKRLRRRGQVERSSATLAPAVVGM